MMFGAMVLTGALVHVFLISLFFEAITRRVPRVLALIPIAAYGAYYAAYLYQGAAIAWTSAELQASNPGKVLDFVPSKYSLVTKKASALIQGYAIPVAYEENKGFQPEGYLSFRLIRRDQCSLRRDSQSRIQTHGVHVWGRLQQGVCVLRFPETPPFKIIHADRRGDDEVWKRKWGISEQVTDIIVDGLVLGSYRTASVWRLPALPVVFIGCALISSTPAWKCGADLKRSHMVIDAIPTGIDRRSYDTPTSVMLGLKKYAEADLADFRGYELNDAALARIAEEPGRVEDSAFATLAAIVEGKNPKPPFNLGYSLAQSPDRLVPFAEKMAARFAWLNQADPKSVPNYREQLEALAIAIVALPRPAFLSVSDQIFAIIQQERSWERYRSLYIRVGDSGAKTFPIYKRDFMSERLQRFSPAVIAICRIGQADEETIAEMKRRLIFGGRSFSDDDYNSALFVALLKLGQELFLRENIGSISGRMRDWADPILEGRGATEAGPNNCMSMRAAYHGPALRPGLQQVRGVWTPRAQTN
jgi:hypothetical protein